MTGDTHRLLLGLARALRAGGKPLLPPAISPAAAALLDGKLIQVEPDRSIVLTKRGRRHADQANINY